MVVKGNLHADGRKLAAYLITGKKGERAELVELRGFASSDIRDAFIDVHIQAAEATQCAKPFFHSYIRLPENEELFRGQWKHVADRIEKQLGFEGQGRAIAFHHQPGGNTHMHIAWSRIDLEQRRARDPGLYKNKLKEISRQLECELGLTRISSERPAGRKTRAPGRKEFEQARRLGTGIAEIREAIRACWDSAENGRSFMAALAAHGLVLARGERRDFVIVDHAGGLHALSKRITGATAAEIRTRLADLDPATLPSISQAKTQQAENPPLDIRNGALTVQPSAVPPVPLKHGGDGKASSSEMANSLRIPSRPPSASPAPAIIADTPTAPEAAEQPEAAAASDSARTAKSSVSGLRKRSCGTKIMEACRPQTGEARACRTEAAPPPPWRCARRCARHVPGGGKNNSPSSCRISECRARRCFFIGHTRLAESVGQRQSRK